MPELTRWRPEPPRPLPDALECEASGRAVRAGTRRPTVLPARLWAGLTAPAPVRDACVDVGDGHELSEAIPSPAPDTTEKKGSSVRYASSRAKVRTSDELLMEPVKGTSLMRTTSRSLWHSMSADEGAQRTAEAIAREKTLDIRIRTPNRAPVVHPPYVPALTMASPSGSRNSCKLLCSSSE